VILTENKIFFFKNTLPRLSRKAVKPREDNRESTVVGWLVWLAWLGFGWFGLAWLGLVGT
jgi:hypothetical protein